MGKSPEANTIEMQLNQLIKRVDTAIIEERFSLAAALLSDAIVLDPNNPTTSKKLFAVAENLFSQQHYEQALVLYNILRLVVTDEMLDEYPEIIFNPGLALIELGELERGEALIREAIKLDEVNEYFFNTFGYYLLNKGEYDEGIECLLESNYIDTWPEQLLSSLEAIAWAYTKQSRDEEAVKVLLEQFEFWLDEKILDLCLRYVRLLDDETAILAIDKFNQSLVKLEEDGRWIDEDNRYLLTSILDQAERYQRIGKPNEALSRFLVIAKEHLDDPRILRGLGKGSLAIGLQENAVQFYQAAVRLEPENPLNYAQLAEALIVQKDYSGALETLGMGLNTAFPNQSKVVRDGEKVYGLPSMTVPNLSELETKNQPAEPDPKAALLLAKADAMSGLERFEDALQTVEQAQKLFPHELIFYRYTAALLLKLDKPRQAQKQLASAREAGIEFDDPTKKLERKILGVLKNNITS